MNDPADLLAAGWRVLTDGAALAGSPARFVGLATVDAQGAPQLRTVALRRADRNAATLEVHTDARSAKMTELLADPRAALLAWHPGPRLQLRATGRMAATSETADRWDAIPQAARGAYGHVPPPGTPIPRADAFDVAPDPAHFAALVMRIEALDIVDIADPSEAGHRRACFTAARDWRGEWLSP